MPKLFGSTAMWVVPVGLCALAFAMPAAAQVSLYHMDFKPADFDPASPGLAAGEANIGPTNLAMPGFGWDETHGQQGRPGVFFPNVMGSAPEDPGNRAFVFLFGPAGQTNSTFTSTTTPGSTFPVGGINPAAPANAGLGFGPRGLAAAASYALFWHPAIVRSEDYAIGADVSFLGHAEKNGSVFKDGGQAKPGLEIFRDHGYNWVRLRLFHSPTRLPNNLAYTIEQAQAAKKLGFKFLLNYHYSDTWADPQKQFIPAAWKDKSHDELVEAVFAYTRDSIAAFREAGVMPEMVQIGNEVIGGMLWPDGRVPQNWNNFADLEKAGIRGVEAGRADATRPVIMMHIDRGGSIAATKHFFDKCEEHGIEFDVIGQSFYPWWHGSLNDLRDNLAFMAERYEKDIILVEVAYNWRTAEYDDEPGPFPETPDGQKQFLADVDRIVRETPNNRGKGIFWWEPAVARSPIASRGMFDNSGNALPVINVFDRFAEVAEEQSGGQ